MDHNKIKTAFRIFFKKIGNNTESFIITSRVYKGFLLVILFLDIKGLFNKFLILMVGEPF